MYLAAKAGAEIIYCSSRGPPPHLSSSLEEDKEDEENKIDQEEINTSRKLIDHISKKKIRFSTTIK